MSMPHKPQKQYRCREYDYSQNGYYFLTICAKDREMFFGDIVEEKPQLSPIGKIIQKFWLTIPAHFPFVKLDQFIIMPNHIHGIIEIDNQNQIVGTGHCPVPTRHCPVPTENQNQNYSTFGHVLPKSISTIIGSFKSITTKTVNLKLPKTKFAWQARFHDRIIRNEDELNRIREYIIYNPLKWENDKNNVLKNDDYNFI